MRNFKLILLFAGILIVSGCSSKSNVQKVDVNITDVNTTVEDNTTITNTVVLDDLNTTQVQENNETNQTQLQVKNDIVINTKPKQKSTKTYTLFEKKFVNHIAYNHYKNAMKLMYEKKHTKAYEEAMKAKSMYDNSLKEKKVIELPYIPGYIRESAQTPRRIYYKIVKEHIYEIKRLIRKIKLLNPPIAYVVLNKTSTYVDVKVQNVGDTPLDNFVVEVNYEQIASFDKIYPNEIKVVRVNKPLSIEQISFTEEYGFAPQPIEFDQE